MLTRKYISCFFTVLLFFSITTIETPACRCSFTRGLRQPPCEEYWKASAVFVGTVTGISIISTSGKDPHYGERSVSFSIEDAFRGVEGPTVEVDPGSVGSDCGFEFVQGERYLVYASINSRDKKLQTNICSRTRALAKASEDLQYIRGLSSAAPGGFIYGEVTKYRSGPGSGPLYMPMTGIKVLIEGEGKQFEAETDHQGRFSVGSLPEGTYNLKILSSQGVTYAGPTRQAKVADRGCAKVDFYL